MDLTVNQIIIIVLIGQTFLFSVLLLALTKLSTRKTSTLILLAFHTALLLNFLNVFILDQGIEGIPHFGLVFGLIYGPIIYFYSLAVIHQGFKWRPIYYAHFVPALFLLLWIIGVDINRVSTPKTEFLITLIFTGVQTVSYLYFSNRNVSFYKSLIKQNKTQYNVDEFNWLRFFINTLALLFLAIFVESFLGLAQYDFYDYSLLLLEGVLLYIITAFILYTIRRPEAFIAGFTSHEIEISKDQQLRYANSTLSAEEAEVYLEKLLGRIENEKLYLDAELSLQKLSEQLNLPARHLSQVINERLDRNFFDFINEYRVKEAERLFHEREDSRVFEVMYDVGFNSRSSFYSAFKKFTGVTPSQFKKKPVNL